MESKRGGNMPQSRRRKRQVIASRRQLEKNRRKVSQKDTEYQENRDSADGMNGGGREDSTSGKSWWEWCASGVTQVSFR